MTPASTHSRPRLSHLSPPSPEAVPRTHSHTSVPVSVLSSAITALGDVATTNARIRYAETGSKTKEDGTKSRPVIFLHDYLASRDTWTPLAGHLPADVRGVLVDLPGFGESDKPAPLRYAYGYDAFANSVLDLIAALSLSRVSIVGHGLGAAIAIRLAAEMPHVVEKLVLVTPRWGSHGTTLRDRMFALPLVGSFAFRRLEGTRDKEGAVHATFLATRDARSVTASLPRVKAKTLAIWGEAFDAVGIASGKRLVREVPGSRVALVPGGNAPHEDSPAEFSKTLMRFLLDGDGTGAYDLRQSSPPPPPVSKGKKSGKRSSRVS